MLSGSEPTKLLADRSMLTTVVLPLLHVSPCHEHGETLVLPQTTLLRTLTVQFHPAVATYKSINALRPTKSQVAGRLVAPVIQVPVHDDALAGNRDVSPDGTVPWRPLALKTKVSGLVIASADSADGTAPMRLLDDTSNKLRKGAKQQSRSNMGRSATANLTLGTAPARPCVLAPHCLKYSKGHSSQEHGVHTSLATP